MFSYNCEKCGREVPPSYSECPDCAAKAGVSPVAAAVLEPEVPAMPQAPAAAVRPAAVETPQAPARPAAAPRPQPVAKQGGVPGWAVAMGVGALLILGGYLFIQVGLPAFRGTSSAAADPAEPVQEAAPAASTPAATDRAPDVAKYVQVTGLRINEVNRRPQVSMVVINHAAAELVDIKSTVLIKTTKSKPGDAPIAKVQLKLGSLGPNEVKDVTVSLPTSLRAYELPDWQFLTAELEPSN